MHALHLRRRRWAATGTALALLAAPAAVLAPASAADLSTTTSTDTSTATSTDTDTAVASDPALVPADPLPAPEDKLTAKAEKALTGGPADFWLELADAADLSAAKDVADWADRGQHVYDALTAVADASQADLVKQLEAAGVAHETFWISNRILVTDGTLGLATDLAASPEVSRISTPVVLEPVEPVERAKSGDKGTQAVEWGLEAINADDVWAQGFTGQGITVSNIDSGVQADHPALAAQYRGLQDDGTVSNDYAWFDSSDACDGAPCDGDGHGTHTMGTMVGDDGAANQIGVAPDAEWIAANGCATCSDADLLESGQWILAPTRADGSDPDPAQRPHVVNNSWGIDAPGVLDDFMAEEIAAWEAAGIFGSWSAGNMGPSCTTTSSPGANEATYAVGAFNAAGDIASFSSRGPGENGVVQPNIAAPGQSVRSSLPGSGYGVYSGTSMAAPHLAGAVALLWSAAPSLVGQIEETQALLDASALDVDETTCGGTADDNNTWGEGKLDVAALLAAAPVGDTGTVAGSITDADGAPVAGATVTFDGSNDRTATTDETGAYEAVLATGDYAVTASAFGFLDSAAVDVTVTADETVTVPIVLTAAPRHAVTGTVADAGSGDPVPGALVELSAPVEGVTSGADGSFAFAGVPEGTYTLTVSAGTCAEPYRTEVTVDGDEVVDAALQRFADDFGYFCATGSAGAAAGDTLLELTGDDAATEVELPFAFPFYGESYDSAFVSTNGFLNFLGSVTSYSNGAIPGASAPNAGVYAFWDDLRVDEEAAVYTGATTVDGTDAFVVEWRNVRKVNPTTDRLTFSATLLADGRVVLGYGDLTDTPTATGSSATVGIEDASGAVASQFSYNDAALTDGLSVTYDLADMGVVTGTVRDGNTRDPLEGATVTLTSKDDGDVKVATTGADGVYSAMLPLERYGIVIEAPGYEAAARNASLTEDGQVVTRNAALGAGMLEVSKESFSASPAMGGTATRAFQVTNTGTVPVAVDLGVADGGFEVLGGTDAADDSAGGVISHVDGDATVPRSGGSSLGKADGGRPAGDGKDGLSTSGAKAGTISPDASAMPLEETTLTHSASQDIVANNSVACSNQVTTQDNAYLRTFTLSDFGIDGAFDVSAVSFAVEAARVAQPLTVNLYTLEGDLVYDNLTLVGSAEATVGTDAGGTVVTVPVVGEVPSGGTLVVEVDVPAGGWFFVGSNDAGQTAPSYLRSEGCDIPEPTDTAEIGYPGMHIVMNVSGEAAGGSGVEWLDVQPPSFTLAPGATVRAAATLSAIVDQPGAYAATVTVGGDTPYAAPTVEALMNVRAPSGWGKLTGTVTGEGAALEGAVVHLDGLASDTTLVTGADGTWARWMPRANGPLQLVVAANGFVPTVRTAQVVAGQTSVYDVDLKPLP
ncbi:carboxypeptidase regulatory-like domain-containing protein [Isoptericola cucumis]|uniref:Peptidase S8/S53 domain-containing protein n=1 Tax=Isoptericola cucumis TaxID=1776856 RepID=A0ABQ2BA59_9MICO|nr:carboxypeptidase regulatory-like domain-containing protein [Isoptericola cucumis]GGI10312.1 hypothetical protein GCM10007368_30610 [Isoptericola cucumis]